MLKKASRCTSESQRSLSVLLLLFYSSSLYPCPHVSFSPHHFLYFPICHQYTHVYRLLPPHLPGTSSPSFSTSPTTTTTSNLCSPPIMRPVLLALLTVRSSFSTSCIRRLLVQAYQGPFHRKLTASEGEVERCCAGNFSSQGGGGTPSID